MVNWGNTLYVEVRFPPFTKRSSIHSAIPRQTVLVFGIHIKEINQASNAGTSTKQGCIHYFYLAFSIEYLGVLPEKPITVNQFECPKVALEAESCLTLINLFQSIRAKEHA